MPAETVHFRLAPAGFFGANPARDAPDQAIGCRCAHR